MRLRTEIVAALPELRREAEALMTDTATLRRATGSLVPDPETLEEVPEMAVVLTSRCKLKYTVTATELVPGQSVAQTQMEWHVPWDTVGVRVGDQVTIDTVDPVTGDPDLPGAQFRIIGPFRRSYATAKRFRIEGWA